MTEKKPTLEYGKPDKPRRAWMASVPGIMLILALVAVLILLIELARGYH